MGCQLCYLLRSSEFTVPSQNQFNPAIHLTTSDIALDNRSLPQLVRITTKQLKTDSFRWGSHIYLERTGHKICPVQAIAAYLAAQSSRPGPLFVLPDNKMLTPQMSSSILDNLLIKLNLDATQFNTHSFRIGGATCAKEAGISDLHIKLMGRWKSDVFQKYIQASPQDLAKLSKRLTLEPSNSKQSKD